MMPPRGILELAKFLLNPGLKPGSVPIPEPLELTPSQILYSDALNNLLHMFALSHEYNHFLLGHLKSDHLKPLVVSGLSLRNIAYYADDLEDEINADRLAIRLLSSGTPADDLIHNAVMVFFKFVYLCNKIMQVEGNHIIRRLDEITSQIDDFILAESEIVNIAINSC